MSSVLDRDSVWFRLRGRQLVGMLALPAALVTGCSSGDSGSEPLGEASLAIAVVPKDVNCIHVAAQGKQRTEVRSFIVGPDKPSLFAHVTGLPLGAVTFMGQAFSQKCDAVTSATEPNWVSDPVAASVVA